MNRRLVNQRGARADGIPPGPAALVVTPAGAGAGAAEVPYADGAVLGAAREAAVPRRQRVHPVRVPAERQLAPRRQPRYGAGQFFKP